MALKSSREGLRKELVDYLGNIIVDDNLRNEIVKAVGDKFVTPEVLNENVNNLTMQITTESGERIGADDTLQNNITAETTAREDADTTLQNNINTETTARQEAIANLEELIRNGGLQMDLLWTNASTTSEFDAQTINVDVSKYKFLILKVKCSIDTDYLYNFVMELSDNKLFPMSCVSYNNLKDTVRTVEKTNDNKLNFGVGYICNNYASYSTDNNYLIPYRIFGVK